MCGSCLVQLKLPSNFLSLPLRTEEQYPPHNLCISRSKLYFLKMYVMNCDFYFPKTKKITWVKLKCGRVLITIAYFHSGVDFYWSQSTIAILWPITAILVHNCFFVIIVLNDCGRKHISAVKYLLNLLLPLDYWLSA